MIKGVNQEIGAHVFIAVNAYEMHMDFVTNPQAFGTCTTIDKLLNYLTIIWFNMSFRPKFGFAY